MDGPVPHAVASGWCGYPVITAVGLDPGCPWLAIISP